MNADSKTIVLVGGSVRAAATDAATAGYPVVAMDHFGDADLRAVCQKWLHLQRTYDWPDAVPDCNATIVPTGGFDWPATGQPFHQGLITFPAKREFDAMRDPKILAELAREVGIHFPTTLLHDDLQNRDLTSHHDWIVKPHTGTGGLGIRSLADRRLSLRESSEAPTLSRSERRHTFAQSQLCPGEYLQQRIPGRPLGVNFISRLRDGKYQVKLLGAFAGLTHRKNREHRWLYGGSIGPLLLHETISSNTQQNLSDLGNHIAKRFELVGLFNVDFIFTPDRRLVLLEINPRYSASMELMPTAGHLVDCHIAAYQEQAGQIDRQQADQRLAAIDQHVGDQPYGIACKRIVYATRPTRFDSSVEGLQTRVRDLSEPHAIEVTYHDIPSSDDLIPSGYPILTIIARYQDATTPSPAKDLIRQTHRIAARIRKMLG